MGCCPFRSVLAGIGMFRWPFRPYRFLFPLESARFGPNRCESGRVGANKKKKKGESVSQTLDAASDPGTATLEPRRCFLDYNLDQMLSFAICMSKFIYLFTFLAPKFDQTRCYLRCEFPVTKK